MSQQLYRISIHFPNPFWRQYWILQYWRLDQYSVWLQGDLEVMECLSHNQWQIGLPLTKWHYDQIDDDGKNSTSKPPKWSQHRIFGWYHIAFVFDGTAAWTFPTANIKAWVLGQPFLECWVVDLQHCSILRTIPIILMPGRDSIRTIPNEISKGILIKIEMIFMREQFFKGVEMMEWFMVE